MAAEDAPIVLRQPRIEPPEGWGPHTREGVLRIDATDDGRLARLDAVVAFIMERDGLPCTEAVAMVCDALAALDEPSQLYLVQREGYARPVSRRDTFAPVGI